MAPALQRSQLVSTVIELQSSDGAEPFLWLVADHNGAQGYIRGEIRMDVVQLSLFERYSSSPEPASPTEVQTDVWTD
jgi:hypothetical protein